ncbi:hypothetical protein [Paludisphaera sp.]|uniref:hypothetical protein n=1 Tax=Paludisphaera sp. TaxID=2017432 RepID=UPI00301DB001
MAAIALITMAGEVPAGKPIIFFDGAECSEAKRHGLSSLQLGTSPLALSKWQPSGSMFRRPVISAALLEGQDGGLMAYKIRKMFYRKGLGAAR